MDQNKKLLALQKDLLSGDEKTVIKAIKETAKSGSPAVMDALIKATVLSDSETVLEEGKKILFNLKDNNCSDALMAALGNDDYLGKHHIIAAAIWEAGLNVDDRLIDLVELAVKRDYLTAIEIMTIIENIETGFPYEEVTDAALTITEYVEESSDVNKNALLLSLASTINSMVAG